MLQIMRRGSRAEGRQDGRQPGRTRGGAYRLRWLLIPGMALAVLATSAPAHAYAVPYYASGYYGSLVRAGGGGDGLHYCEGPSFLGPRKVTSGQSQIYAANYGAPQTITRVARLQYWNGRSWQYTGTPRTQSRPAYVVGYASFSVDPGWTVTVGSFRVVHHYYWYVSTTVIGQAGHTFTVGSYAATFGAWSSTDHTGYGYCHFPS
jgi:hypothetical protein